MLDTDRANTVDLMKFLLSYASDPYVPSEGNSLNERNLLESSVRNLFGELFKLSYSAPGSNSFDSVQSQMSGRFGDAKPPAQKIEMKRGDWICPRYYFITFNFNYNPNELSNVLLCVMVEHHGQIVRQLL